MGHWLKKCYLHYLLTDTLPWTSLLNVKISHDQQIECTHVSLDVLVLFQHPPTKSKAIYQVLQLSILCTLVIWHTSIYNMWRLSAKAFKVVFWLFFEKKVQKSCWICHHQCIQLWSMLYLAKCRTASIDLNSVLNMDRLRWCLPKINHLKARYVWNCTM